MHRIELLASAGNLEKLKTAIDFGVDAVLIADPALMNIAKEVVPNLEIHLSTQANNLNYKSALFWNKAGVSRVVAAREMSLVDLNIIYMKKQKLGIIKK